MAAGRKLDAFKQSFFDRVKVEKAVEKVRIRNLSKCGAFVRTRGRSLLRRRKKPSFPGQPPSVHSKDKFASLKNILFGYDPATRGVIVGPVAVNGNRDNVPQLMEKGGTARRRAKYVPQKTKTGKKRKTLEIKKLRNARTVHYEQRPFMAPALRQEMKHFAKVWKNTVKATN